MLKQLLIFSYATLLFCGLAFTGVAQNTIIQVLVSHNQKGTPGLCNGESISVTFNPNATPAPFSVELSDGVGNFASPTLLATGTSSPINTNIPSNTITGSGYRIRVKSGLITGVCPTIFQISVDPGSPGLPPGNTINLCKGGPSSVSPYVTASSNNTLVWYSSDNATEIKTTEPVISTNNAGTYVFYVTQKTAGGCEHASRARITVNVIDAPAPSAQTTYTYCQGGTASTLTASGSDLKWYNSSNTPLSVAPKPDINAAGNQSFKVTQTINGCVSSPTTINVNVNQRADALPPANTNTNVQLCAGQPSGPLSATPTSTNTIRWYDENNLPISAPKPDTDVSSTTTKNYFVTQATSAGCEAASRVSVTATVNFTPQPLFKPGIGIPISECLSKPTRTLDNYISPTAGNTLIWYGTGGPGSTTPTMPNNAPLGQTEYFVTNKSNSTNCESKRTPIAVQVYAVPGKPSVTKIIDLCLNSGNRQLSANPSGGASLLWWGTGSGSSSGTAPTHVPNEAKTTTYYVSQIANGCESDRESIDVVVHAPPADKPGTATNILYCKDATTVNLSATTTGGSGNTLRWYIGNSSLPSAPKPSSDVGGTTTTQYQVSQISPAPGNCEGPKEQINVTVYVSPAPGVNSPVTYCQNASAQILTANTASGATVNWYTAPSGVAPGGVPTPSTATATTVSYYVSQTLYAVPGFAGCESPKSTINVVVNPLPAKPTVSNPSPICQTYGTGPLTATGSSLKWYTNEIGGTSSNSITPSTENAGNTNYYVSQTNNFNCEGPRAQITVTINPTPGKPGVNPITYCQNYSAVALNASADGGNTLKWYGTSASGGTSNTASPTPSTSNPGQTSFYVSQTNGFACESQRGQLVVTVNPTPGNPGATTPIFYCNTSNSQPLSANGENLKWYSEPNGGTASGLAPSPSTGNVGTTSFYVTQSNQFNCESPRTEVKVTIKPLPPTANVPKQEYLLCQFDQSVTLDAQLAGTGQSLVWTLPNNNETGNAPVITTEAGFVGSFNVLQVLDGCRGPRTEIKVNVRTTPLPTVSAVPVVSCQNSTPQALQAVGEKLKWYNTNKTGGTPQDTPNIPPTQTPGTYQFYVTQTGTNTCESPRAEITVVIQPLPSATLTGGGTITQGQPTNLTIAFTGQGPWTYTLSNGLTLTTSQNPVTIQTYPLETTVYNVTKITNNCGEGTPAGSASIQVKIATIDVGNPSATTICASQAFTIPYFSSDFFPSSTQFRVQISKTQDDAGFQTVPTEGTGSPIKATLPNATPGGTYYVRVVGVASVAGNNFTIKGKLSPVQINVRELPTATISGPVRVYENENAKLAIAFTGETPWRITYRDSLSTKDTTFSTSVSPYEFTVKPGKTNTYSVVSISNGCGNGPATSKFVLIVDPVLGVEPALSSEWIKVYPVPVQARCTIEIDGTGGKTVSLTIIDGLGRTVVRQQTSSNKDEMDLSGLAPGMYFLNAEREGQIARRKILKVQ